MAQQAEDAVSATAPTSRKKLLMALIALLVVGGAGGGAWYYLQAKPAHAKPVEKPVEVPKPPVFVTLETFTVNLQSDVTDEYLQVDITLQVQDELAMAALKENMPQVRNRLLMLLTSKQASALATVEGKQQLAGEIRQQLNLPFNSSDKTEEVSAVFFTSFVIQ
ncbi:flagellar basal body-associated protein FliL [Pseudomethylobacillus aquaticus]|uniref:Flagellar protein FliL n=1 Tax=Pseudomethylobacillus aquaticus TaxID=2676064 RepID=A0A3N0V0I3_9PROT|nr:flagellar basal body-associated protein FliL [Pseudomethylobacillus aquaticus]ROH86122.1 flagellar basal body-associated protein FliL [Pseudomethylobacillus aquaticus]